MNILIAEDDLVSRRTLETTLKKWGYDVVAARDGEEAWSRFQTLDVPRLAIIDWMMPAMDGLELCRRIRGTPEARLTYLVLLTARSSKSDIAVGLENGADDYITKPFDRAELRARLLVGIRTLKLQKTLADRVRELELATARIHQLHGLLPICSYCKRIRDDANYWQGVEEYVAAHADVQFSHGICPDCYHDLIKPQLEEMRTK